jgi:hypothetical protein
MHSKIIQMNDFILINIENIYEHNSVVLLVVELFEDWKIAVNSTSYVTEWLVEYH